MAPSPFIASDGGAAAWLAELEADGLDTDVAERESMICSGAGGFCFVLVVPAVPDVVLPCQMNQSAATSMSTTPPTTHFHMCPKEDVI